LLFASVVYDPAIHLTSQEYEKDFGKAIDVQKIVEESELFIVAR